MSNHPLRAPVFLTNESGDSLDTVPVSGSTYTLDPQTGLPYDPTIAAPVVQPKSATITPSQTSVGTTAVKLFNLNASAADRLVRCITVDMFIGPATVTASGATGGFLVKAGSEPIRLPASVGEVYGITASGTATAYTLEQ